MELLVAECAATPGGLPCRDNTQCCLVLLPGREACAMSHSLHPGCYNITPRDGA